MPQDATNKTAESSYTDADRRKFLTDMTTAFGVAGAACAAYPFVRSMNPSADVKALANTEVDLSDLAEGQSKTVLWRGKPVFIKHRTPREIDEARALDADPAQLKALADPQKDSDRVQNEKFLVVLAVCSHLGCVPIEGGTHSGWLCPCHGSQFDSSGRRRAGPAPTNLEVPPYTFIAENRILIG
jgi:ubiquinol-cytochrome c reductase iron-sulfur subunit